MQDWRFQQARPPLGVHSHPSRFLPALPPQSRKLYELFYLHHAVIPEVDWPAWPGLVEKEDPAAVALWQIAAVRGAYILSSIQGRSPGEFVYLGDDSGLLMQACPSEGERAADLCCGCGVLGLHLARGFREVVGLDFNAQAVEVASWNAELNRIDNYRPLLSDMWSAAEGEFDFVIGNPPALPLRGEQRNLMYAFGGEQAASLTWRAVEGLEKHLAPGGRCLLLSFSVRDELWKGLQERLDGRFSLRYRPRRRLRLADPALGWMEHVWLDIRRDSRGLRKKEPLSWSDRLETWAFPWPAEKPLQACYAGNQRSSN